MDFANVTRKGPWMGEIILDSLNQPNHTGLYKLRTFLASQRHAMMEDGSARCDNDQNPTCHCLAFKMSKRPGVKKCW